MVLDRGVSEGAVSSVISHKSYPAFYCLYNLLMCAPSYVSYIKRHHTELVNQFRYRGDFRLLQTTWSIWKEQARAKKRKRAADGIKATLVQEQRSLQIARDFSHSRLLATTFFAWRRWAKRYINLCHFSPPLPSRPPYFTLVLCLSRFRLIYANTL